VSLHSHTLHSRESLDFIYHAATRFPLLAAAVRAGERRHQKLYGKALNLARGWWTPPLGPRDAWLVETSQIEDLDLNALVSLTDHDDIEASVLLQLLNDCQQTPISFEWTVPFRATFFHLGIHNLPTAIARDVFAEMQQAREASDERRLLAILSEIASCRQSLIVFNHPLWDEKRIGQRHHDAIMLDFLLAAKESIHAFELNGLRPWRENRNVIALAEAAAKPLISGGDRHAFEPNALLNLTNAGTFAEFSEEVRSGWSDVLILQHYREPYALRILHNLMDVLKIYDGHVNGWRLWNDRVFYACDDGRVRSLTELFSHGLPPPVAMFVGVMELMSKAHIRRLLRGAFPAREEITL
jgi:hypothetical protein